LSAYFLFYKRNNDLLSAGLTAGAKSLFLIAVLSSGNTRLFAVAMFAGLLVMLLFAASSDNEKTVSKKEYGVIIGFTLFALVFFQGCNFNNTAIMPSVRGELNFDFVPSEIATDSNDELYVGTERDKFVYLYGTYDKKQRAVYQAGLYPYDMIKDGSKLYIAGKMGGIVTVYDLPTGKRADIDTLGKYPSAIALDKQKNILYAANMGSASVSVIDLNLNKTVKLISTGKWPAGLYLPADGRLLYTACKYTNTVEIIDTEKQQVVFTLAQVGTSPSALVPLGKRDVAVINEWEYAFNHKGSLTVFDRLEYRVKANYLIPGGASSGVLSKSRRYLYMAVPLKDMVVFMDIKKGEVVDEVKFDRDSMPNFMALSGDGRTLYVTCQKQKKVEMISVNGLI
jgi:YVTN family beta-propeller protein